MAQSSLLPVAKLKARIEDGHPNTEPFEETAVHDIPSVETQLVDSNGDTEVLDIPDFADNLRAQIVDDSEKEVMLDSDDEEIQRNKALTVIKEMSCDGPDRTMGHKSGETPNEDKKQLDPANNHSNLGFSMRRCSPVAVSASVEAICLAKDSLTDMGSNNGHCSDHVDPQYDEAPVMKNGNSGLQNQRTIDTNVDAINPGHSSCVPEPARLSYIESQEPGGTSQAALDFVDHYLSVNDVNLPQEVKIGNLNKLTSPPALSAKGSWNLARGANLRTKASDSRTFEWDENPPELFLGWKSHRARSVSMPQLANDLKLQDERKVGEKCKDFNLNLIDSRIIVHKSNQISELRKAAETASRMQSSKELGKQFDAEPMRKQPETSSNEREVPDMDVGFDTQMAAEAIEALLYAPPPSHDANTDQILENILENTSESETGKKVAMDFSFLDSGSSGSEVSVGYLKCSSKAVYCDLPGEIDEKVRSSPPVECQTGILLSLKSSMTTKDTECDYGGKRRSGLDTDKLLGERKKGSKLGFDSSMEATNYEVNGNKKTSPDIATSMSNLNSNQICEVRKTAEKVSRMQSSKELGKQFDAEPLNNHPETNSNEWDVPEMDAGFDTQMAAEAIEALLYAPPPSHNAYTDHCPENFLENTSKCDTVKKIAMDFSLTDSDSSDSEATARFLTRTKRSDYKLSGNKSTSIQIDSKNKEVLDLSVEGTKKVRRGMSLTDKCTGDVNPKSRVSKTSSKVITRKEVEEFSEEEDISYIRNLRSSKAVSCNLLGQIDEKVRSCPPVARRTGIQSSLKSSMTTKNTEYDYGGKRRRSCLDTDNLLRERKKGSRLGFDSSVEGTDEANRNKKTSPDISTSMSNLKSNPWIFPKKKRTFQYVSHFSGFPNTLTSSIVLDEENCNGSYKGCQITSEGELRTPCLGSIVKRKVRSAQSFWHSSKETCVENKIAGKFSEESLESLVITGQMGLVNSAKDKASGMSSKLDKVVPTLFAGEENKENELSNVNVKASANMSMSGKDYKQQYKRNFPGSPLLKELTRLGFAESLPNFLSKDLRRRRNKSNIRVLCCQRLDDRTIKKQKKILVRLGISVASDSSDATHFVTDRFVRTRNMLEAMALGKPVVTHLWLENCLEAKCFVDEKNYILQDFKMEKELGFSMLVSLARAKEHPLLKDQRVIVTPNAKPSREMIESLVKKVHGQAQRPTMLFCAFDKDPGPLLLTPIGFKVVKVSQKTARKDKVMSNDLLILSCKEDYAACVPFLEEGAAVYSSELLLNGIVIQKLEYERHRLFNDHVHTSSRTIH